MNADAPNPALIAELQIQDRSVDAGLPPAEAPSDGRGKPLSRAFRWSSTLAGLAAGMALIAYGEGMFDPRTPAPAATMRVPPKPRVEPTRDITPPVPAAMRAQPAAPSKSGAVAKKRAAKPKRSARAVPPETTDRPIAQAEPPRRRNFLGLRTVGGWVARHFPGARRSDRSGQSGR